MLSQEKKKKEKPKKTKHTRSAVSSIKDRLLCLVRIRLAMSFCVFDSNRGGGGNATCFQQQWIIQPKGFQGRLRALYRETKVSVV